MRFILAQCISFVLGLVVAVVLMKIYNPQIEQNENMEHKPYKNTPERIGPPPEHDIKNPPNRPPN